jgi:primosomal protein N'
MVQLTLMHKDEELVVRTARELVMKLNQADCGEVLGPTWPPVRRIRDQYHQVVLVKLPVDHDMMRRKKSIHLCVNGLQLDTYYRKVRVVPDVDPV